MTAWWESTQARQLTELYRALRLYVNCFQPSMRIAIERTQREKDSLRV
jgi:hypothetical protein